MRYAVITGASSGIGKATAEEFAQRGYSVAILARRADLLQAHIAELSQGYPQAKFLALACDVSSWAQVTEVAERVGREFGQVNVLVNNAGAFDYQSLEKASIEKIDEMVAVNVRGVIYVSKAFLSLLKKGHESSRQAKVINVSSIAGLWGFSHMAAYTATKFAVAGFGSALRRELKPHGIQVSTIFPGPVNTKLPKGKRPDKKMVMTPEQIAEQIADLAASPARSRVSHPIFTALQWLETLSPDSVDKLLKKIL